MPDWRLPEGVNRGLWDYLRDAELAELYDSRLADSPLCRIDLAFAERHFPHPGRLVDLGCGTGRLLLHFADRGFWVLGVDLSEPMLRVARKNARARGLAVHLAQANLVDLRALAENSFDHAACLFSTLGMVLGEKNRRAVVAGVYRLLRPGGRLVLHVHNRWFSLWSPAGRAWLLRDRFRALRRHPSAGDRAMPVHQGIAGLTLHLFTRAEIIRLLRRAGFAILECMALGFTADGGLSWPAWLPGLRAHGFLIAAEKPR